MRHKVTRSRPTTTSMLTASMTLSVACLGIVLLSQSAIAQSQEAATSASSSAVAKAVGTVKALSGNTITLTTDTGATVNIVVQDSTRLVRIAPGQKDLKDAAPIQLSD